MARSEIQRPMEGAPLFLSTCCLCAGLENTVPIVPFTLSPLIALAEACLQLSRPSNHWPKETLHLQLQPESCLPSVFPTINTSGSLVIPWLQPSVHRFCFQILGGQKRQSQ